MNITGRQLIGFNTDAEEGGGDTFDSNVGDENGRLYTFREATDDDVAQAVTLAQSSFDAYRQMPVAKRVAFLRQIAANITAAAPEMIPVAMQESHLPQARLTGEVMRTTGQIHLFADLLEEGSWVGAVIDTALPDRKPLPRPDIRQMQVPLGVTGVFGASNFPFAFSVAGGDTISALAAGCPVVHKAHPAHPVTAEMVAQCIMQAAQETGMPDGVFSLLHGRSHQSGISIVMHPLVKAIAFTGSFTGGTAIYAAAAQRREPIPVYAEMGSVNPVFILPRKLQSDGAAIAKTLSDANLLGTGQFCTNPGLLFTSASAEGDSFQEIYTGHIKNATSGAMLTQGIYDMYSGNTERLKGVATLAGSGFEGADDKAVPHVFKTTGSDFMKHEVLCEEVFGPSSILITADDKEQLFEIARNLPGQLTASVWGTEEDCREYAALFGILQLKAGRVILNAAPTGVEVTAAMVHGGPFPATTDSRTTSVGTCAIYRFVRPVCFQGLPDFLLPEALQDANPLGIARRVNGKVVG